MPEYIKLKSVFRILDNVMSDENIKHKGKAIRKRLKEMKTTEVAEVRHGEWVEQEHGLIFVCSVCNFPTDYKLTTYCPCCGAKMDKKEGVYNG